MSDIQRRIAELEKRLKKSDPDERRELYRKMYLAMKDMEIRGAGNLLGAEQSGHIHEVGIDTYMEMFEAEVAAIRGNPPAV